MLNHRVVLTAASMFFAAFAVPTSALANIDLEWRPETQTVLVGDTVSVGLYAVPDDPELNQCIAAMDVILTWEPDFLDLTGNLDNGPYDWLFSGFPNDSGLDGLNDTWADGDALYSAYAQFLNPAWATPGGLLVTTFQFTALAETAETTLSIPEHAGQYTDTAVYDCEIPGLDVHGTLGGATVTILAEPPPGDCDTDLDVDLDDYATFHYCLEGPDVGPVAPECQCVDLDEDDDVDLVDFAAFQTVFTGPAGG